MSKKIKGDNNVVIEGDKNTVMQSPVFNINPKVINKLDKPSNSITEEDAHKIKGLIDEIVKNTKLPYPAVWKKFKNHVKVTEYKALPKEKYQEAIVYLTKWRAATTKNLKASDTITYRKNRYAAIYARLKNLGITKEQFAVSLEKKYSVTSLKELSINDLEQVYISVMNTK